jgi:hypothetical protein
VRFCPIFTEISCPAWLGQPSASMRNGRRIMTWWGGRGVLWTCR